MFSTCHLAEILQWKSSERISACLGAHRGILSWSRNSLADVHCENSLVSTYHLLSKANQAKNASARQAIVPRIFKSAVMEQENLESTTIKTCAGWTPLTMLTGTSRSAQSWNTGYFRVQSCLPYDYLVTNSSAVIRPYCQRSRNSHFHLFSRVVQKLFSKKMWNSWYWCTALPACRGTLFKIFGTNLCWVLFQRTKASVLAQWSYIEMKQKRRMSET